MSMHVLFQQQAHLGAALQCNSLLLSAQGKKTGPTDASLCSGVRVPTQSGNASREFDSVLDENGRITVPIPSNAKTST